MNRTLRALAAATCSIALVVAGIAAYPALAGDGESDVWTIVDWRARITTSEREARDLAKREEVIVRRTALRSETVTDLVAGRISPEDALTRFIDLNRTSPLALRRVREQFPGDTDEERAVWQLVAHVRAIPDVRAEAVADETACRLAYPAR